MVVTKNEKLQLIKITRHFNHMVLQGHVTDENRISTNIAYGQKNW